MLRRCHHKEQKEQNTAQHWYGQESSHTDFKVVFPRVIRLLKMLKRRLSELLYESSETAVKTKLPVQSKACTCTLASAAIHQGNKGKYKLGVRTVSYFGNRKHFLYLKTGYTWKNIDV